MILIVHCAELEEFDLENMDISHDADKAVTFLSPCYGHRSSVSLADGTYSTCLEGAIPNRLCNHKETRH